MSDAMKSLLKAMAAGELGADEASAAFALALDGAATQSQIAAFLAFSASWLGREEILIAGARAMRERMAPVKAPPGAIDVCGTGGDGAHTLNVSTAVAFVIAACGIPVAKHGNRAASSRSGAADVLEALGVNLAADPARQFAAANLAFLFAPNHHPALAALAPIRRDLGFRSIFNVLGPLCNPADVKRQLVGISDRRVLEPVGRALKSLGAQCAWVVIAESGVDEVTPGGQTFTYRLRGEMADLSTLTPADFGRPDFDFPVEALRGGTPAENAAALRSVLSGQERGAYRAAVLLNAAAGLHVARASADEPAPLAEALAEAAAAIDDGRALLALENLIKAGR